MKEERCIRQYPRKKGGKVEIVSEHNKMVNVKPNLPYSKQKAVMNGKSKTLGANPRFNRWIDTFIDEKGIDLDTPIEFEDSTGMTHYMTVGVVLENIKAMPPEIQAKFKDMIVRIDFSTPEQKPILDYFEYIGKGLAEAMYGRPLPNHNGKYEMSASDFDNEDEGFDTILEAYTRQEDPVTAGEFLEKLEFDKNIENRILIESLANFLDWDYEGDWDYEYQDHKQSVIENVLENAGIDYDQWMVDAVRHPSFPSGRELYDKVHSLSDEGRDWVLMRMKMEDLDFDNVGDRKAIQEIYSKSQNGGQIKHSSMQTRSMKRDLESWEKKWDRYTKSASDSSIRRVIRRFDKQLEFYGN